MTEQYRASKNQIDSATGLNALSRIRDQVDSHYDKGLITSKELAELDELAEAKIERTS